MAGIERIGRVTHPRSEMRFYRCNVCEYEFALVGGYWNEPTDCPRHSQHTDTERTENTEDSDNV